MRAKHFKYGVMLIVAIIAVLALPGTAAAVGTDFESVSVGTFADDIVLPGVDFISGLGVPGNWTVQDNAGVYASLSGHILTNAAGDCTAAIQMHFTDLQASISFLYGSDPGAYPDAVLYLYTGGNPTPGIGTLVHSSGHYGTDLGTGKSEGAVSVTVDFDYVVLFSTNGCLAIDNLNTTEASLGPLGPDMIPLPLNAAVGTIIEPTEAMWAPMEGAYTDVMLYPGMKLWVLGQDESGQYYKVALSGVILWVKVEAMGPNYDDTWQGHPLPTDVN